MKHTDLIHMSAALNYLSLDSDGLCSGFTGMWIQAVCLGESEVEQFNKRMRLLERYASSPQKLPEDIAKVRHLVKQGTQELTNNQKMLLEIPAFFEGIRLYLNPEQHDEVWGGKKFTQINAVDISQYTQSKMLEEQGGLSRAFLNLDYYDQVGLITFLNKLGDKLQDRKDVGINLGVNNHSVAIRVLGKNKFQLLDTNHLDKAKKTYSSEELAKQLNQSFFNTNSWFNWFSEPKPFLMKTSIFNNQSKPINDIERLHSTKKITKLLATKPFNILMGAIHSDVNTLNRIDFNVIDVNQTDARGNTALQIACMLNNQDAINVLLTIPSINVNPGKISPLECCLYTRKYHLAKQILEHPSFKPQDSSDGNALHFLAKFNYSSSEQIEIASEIIKKGVDVNAKNSFGIAPAYYACGTKNLQLVKLLFEQGADPFVLTSSNDTLLHIVTMSDDKDLTQLLLDKGLDPNQLNDNRMSPLHLACEKGHKQMVDTFISQGGDCNIRNRDGLTPLMLACKNGHSDLIPMLLLKTNLSVEDIGYDSSLVKQIANCSQATQIEFLKNALTGYIQNRSADKQYLNVFNLGFSRSDKTQAAQALLDRLNGKEVNLQPHIDALTDGRLSCLFNLSFPHLNNLPKQEPFSDDIGAGSTKKMCTLMGVNLATEIETNTNTVSSSAGTQMTTPEVITIPARIDESELSATDGLNP